MEGSSHPLVPSICLFFVGWRKKNDFQDGFTLDSEPCLCMSKVSKDSVSRMKKTNIILNAEYFRRVLEQFSLTLSEVLFNITGIKIPLGTPDITLTSTMVGLKYSMAHKLRMTNQNFHFIQRSSHQKFMGTILDKDYLSEL